MVRALLALSRGVGVAGMLAVLTAAGTAAAEPGPVYFTLDNGLHGCVAEDRSTDLVAVQVVFHVTADCEPGDKAGIRALLQHTLRFGWELRLKSEEALSFLADMDDAGGGLSSTTDWEYVAFGYEGTSDTLGEALAFLAQNVFLAEITKEAHEGARGLLQSVQAERQGQPAESTHALFRLALWNSSPRAYPLGTPQTLEAISLADLASFHRRFCVPNLAAVCIAGPVTAADGRALIDKRYGAFPAGRGELPGPPPEPAGSDSRAALNTGLVMGRNPDFELASLVVGVPAPGYDDPDYAVTHVIQALLGPLGDKRGLLDRDEPLWDGLGLTLPGGETRAGGFIESLPPQLALRNYLAVHAYVAPGRVESTHRALGDHFRSLAEKPASGAELSAAREYARNANARMRVKLATRALLLGRGVVLGMPETLVTDFDRRVMGVTAKDVQRVAQRCFGREGVGIEYAEAPGEM